MANLYDKIRKKKKENLEKIYKDLSAPKSMAESVAKFKSIDSSAAYGGGKAAANIQAAIGEGAKAKETGEYPTNWGAFSTHELPQWLPESEEYLDGDN